MKKVTGPEGTEKLDSINDNRKFEAPKRRPTDIVFTILWYGGVLVLVAVLPVYFTITNTGTAAWLIQGQAWIYKKLLGTGRWHPVATGMVTAAIHVLALVGIVKGASGLAGWFKKIFR